MDKSEWAILISALGFIVMVVEKIFGGGNGLANRFATLKETLTADVARVRMESAESAASTRHELTRRIDEYEDNYRVGFDAIKSGIHELQMAALKFRAEMAEGYLPKGGLDDVRRDMRDGFNRMDQAVEHLQDMIMWSNNQDPERHNGRPGTGPPKGR